MRVQWRKEMEDDFAADEDKAEHIWNGEYGAGQGAILAKWVNKARRLGRIHEAVSFDPDGAPVEIFSDIGFRDTACWWFCWQYAAGGTTLRGRTGRASSYLASFSRRSRWASGRMCLKRHVTGPFACPGCSSMWPAL